MSVVRFRPRPPNVVPGESKQVRRRKKPQANQRLGAFLSPLTYSNFRVLPEDCAVTSTVTQANTVTRPKSYCIFDISASEPAFRKVQEFAALRARSGSCQPTSLAWSKYRNALRTPFSRECRSCSLPREMGGACTRWKTGCLAREATGCSS